MDLSDISFGDRVAENEASELASYFVKTDDWSQLRAGKIDVVFGAKGAGKSALYTLLNQDSQDFEDSGILLMSAESQRAKLFSLKSKTSHLLLRSSS